MPAPPLPKAPPAEDASPPTRDAVAALEGALARDPARTEALAHQIADDLEALAGVRLTGLLQSLRPLVLPAGRPRSVARGVLRATAALVRALEDPSQPPLPGLSAPPPRRHPGDLDLLRPDGALSADGTFSLFELNVGSCVGGLVEIERLSHHLQGFFGDLPLRWPRPATDLVRALRLRFPRARSVAWVVEPASLRVDNGMAPLGEHFARIARAEGLSLAPVEADAVPADTDLLVRVVDPITWSTAPAFAHLRDAVARGHLSLFTSTYDLALNHKGLLARVSLAGELSPRAATVPWTRLARPSDAEGYDLLPTVRDDPDAYVLKPCIDRQGRRVVLGREAREHWGQHLVAAVLADDMALQRFVPLPETRLPFWLDGALVRAPVGVVASPVLLRGARPSLCARTSVPGQTRVLTHPFAATTGLLPMVELL